jgi:hypothetical protein
MYSSLASRFDNPMSESTISSPVRNYEFGYWVTSLYLVKETMKFFFWKYLFGNWEREFANSFAEYNIVEGVLQTHIFLNAKETDSHCTQYLFVLDKR